MNSFFDKSGAVFFSLSDAVIVKAELYGKEFPFDEEFLKGSHILVEPASNFSFDLPADMEIKVFVSIAGKRFEGILSHSEFPVNGFKLDIFPLKDAGQNLPVMHIVKIDSDVALSDALKEKEVLVKEVYHRVKNNLQMIISMFSLQSKYITDEKLLALFGESQNRIMAISLVHECLYTSKNLTEINIREYLTKLVDYLCVAFSISEKSIKCNTDIDENIYLDIKRSTALGIIINELYTNSFKHAFVNGKNGNINLKFYSEGNGLLLEFSDDGIGIKDPETGKGSFGMELIKILVKQLKAEISFSAENGTKSTIKFTK